MWKHNLWSLLLWQHHREVFIERHALEGRKRGERRKKRGERRKVYSLHFSTPQNNCFSIILLYISSILLCQHQLTEVSLIFNGWKFSGLILHISILYKEGGRGLFFGGGCYCFSFVLAHNLWRPWPVFLLPWWPDYELMLTAKSLLAQFLDSWRSNKRRRNLYDHLNLTWITQDNETLSDFLTSGSNLISIHHVTFLESNPLSNKLQYSQHLLSTSRKFLCSVLFKCVSKMEFWSKLMSFSYILV